MSVDLRRSSSNGKGRDRTAALEQTRGVEFVASVPESLSTDGDWRAGLETRLGRMESLLQQLVEQKTVKDWYSTEEVAERLGKAEFTVREWCRNGRLHAEKKGSGRGPHAGWVISHQELLRYQREGLLPIKQA